MSNELNNGGQIVADQDRMLAEVVNHAPEALLQEVGGVRFIESPVLDRADYGTEFVAGDEEVLAEASDVNVHRVQTALILSLDVTRIDLAERKDLKSVNIETDGTSAVFNLYSPFSRSSREKNAAPGVIRSILKSVLAISDLTNAEGPIVVLADAYQAEALVARAAAGLVARLTSLFPIVPTAIVIPETDEADAVMFHDMFAVSAWTAAEEDDTGVVHTIYLNLAVNSAALFASTEPHKFVERAMSTLQSFIDKEESNLQSFVAIRMASDLLDSPPVQDLLAILTTDPFNFASLSKHLVDRDRVDWIPSGASFELFGQNSDFVLFRELEVDLDDAGDDTGAVDPDPDA